MIVDRVSLMSKRSAYNKNKGIKMGEVNTSRKFINKGPIKATPFSPQKLELMTLNMSQTLPRKAVRPQTAPANRALIRI
jgi:hypothetical protein